MAVEPHLITSLQNPTVKFIRSLELRKDRKESGMFAAEGVKVIATARDHGWRPETILFDGKRSAHAVLSRVARVGGQRGGEVLSRHHRRY